MGKLIQFKKIIFNNTLIIIFFSFSFLLYLTKLDYHYFFTDEILYYQKGVDMLGGIFDNTLQVPPLQKYLAGISFLLFNPDLFLMRLPFAILGFLSSIIVFLIIKKETNVFFGLLSASLYLFGKIIFDSSRMMMLEPVLHFFWLLFIFYFYKIYSEKNQNNSNFKYYLISGFLLGLALATKITSILLIFLVISVFIIKSREERVDFTILLKNFLALFGFSLITLFIFYLPHLYYSGVWNTIKDTLKDILEVYLDKSSEGKDHVINGQVYVISPWWFYFEAQIKNDGVYVFLFKYLFGIFAIFSRNKFSTFWGILFFLSFAFHQFSGVKNVRYISTFEIPLIILSVWGLYYFLNNFLKIRESFQKIIIVITIFVSFINISTYLINLKHTEYLGVFNFFKKETDNFQIKKRIFIFGSIRTLKYYTKLLPEERYLTYKRQYNIYCPEFNEYSYFAFDKEELIKDPENDLYRFVNSYIDNFEIVTEIDDMLVYKKVKEFNYSEFCQ